MSVRMAIVKLSAVVAGGALIGGGAVHMAEKAATGKPQYVKHAKAPVHHHAKRAPIRAKATAVASTTCKTTKCQPHEELAVVPLPAPNIPAPAVVHNDTYQDFGGPHGDQYYESMGNNSVVVIDRNRHDRRHPQPPFPPTPEPTPVPAPPMLVLFGLAAAALFGRQRLAKTLA